MAEHDTPPDEPTQRTTRARSVALAMSDLVSARDRRDLDQDGEVSNEELAAASRARVDGYRIISRTVIVSMGIAAATYALASGMLGELHVGMDGVRVTGALPEQPVGEE